MQIEKNQGKTNFRTVEANFCNVFAIFNFKHFTRIYIRGCGILIFHFFLSLLVFVLPLYFLFENGIDPVFSFVMSYSQLHRKWE